MGYEKQTKSPIVTFGGTAENHNSICWQETACCARHKSALFLEEPMKIERQELEL